MRFDAVAYLRSLFDDCKPTVPVAVVRPDDLPAEWHVVWDERAAIMEYDGGLHRELAELEALRLILDEMRRQGLT